MKFISTEKWVRLFPVLAIAFSLVAYNFPTIFGPLKSWIIPLLSVVMFCMGMTLNWQHLLAVIKHPKIVFLGVSIQYLVMPFTAYWLSTTLGLTLDQTIGMVLVGSTAGGTASNVICYLAKGNVALSILMTITSTFVAVVATPSLTFLYLNETVQVPFWKMLNSILQIVLVPVLLGTGINSLFTRGVAHIRPLFPMLSSLIIVLIIAIIVAINAKTLGGTGPILIIAVMLHNISGLMAGYFIPKLFGYDSQTCRTISIEVGMQNSGLSVALAIKYFSSMTALPGAIFSIWHNISGALVASVWGKSKHRKRNRQPS